MRAGAGGGGCAGQKLQSFSGDWGAWDRSRGAGRRRACTGQDAGPRPFCVGDCEGAGGPHSNRINMVPIKDVRECSDGRRVRNCCTCQSLRGRCLVSAAVAGSLLARESRHEHDSAGS